LCDSARSDEEQSAENDSKNTKLNHGAILHGAENRCKREKRGFSRPDSRRPERSLAPVTPSVPRAPRPLRGRRPRAWAPAAGRSG
jgi:hypothetical protein